MILKCAVVDDSSIQRLSIVKLIKEHSSLELVAEYKNALETKKGLTEKKVDLIFLDIEMPVINGFELLDVLQNKPQIIFVTGKKEYAFKAFEYDAIDYLHKPITIERFNTSVQKAIEYHKLKNDIHEDTGEYIFVKSNLKKRKIFVSEIKWIEALGDYIKIVCDNQNYIVLSTMKSFEKTLDPYNFLRVHKSYIANLNRIERFNSKFIEIASGTIPLSRNKKVLLTEALEELNAS